MASWKNIRGKLHAEISELSVECRDLVSGLVSEQDCELTIEFLSSGYYMPAKTYGPPENCYPEEGDEERIFDCATINGKAIPQEIGQKLFELLTNEIDDVELEHEDSREFEGEQYVD
jgi:hypothetical protein